METTVRLLKQEYPEATILGIPADVSRPEDMQALASTAAMELGGIDVWINNAGRSQAPKAPLHQTPVETIKSINFVRERRLVSR